MITDYSRCFLVASLDLLCFGLSICVHGKEKRIESFIPLCLSAIVTGVAFRLCFVVSSPIHR